MELFGVRDLGFLVPVTAFPDWRVDQLYVAQPRLPIVNRRVDELLGCPTVGAPSRRPCAWQFQNPVSHLQNSWGRGSAQSSDSQG